MTTAEKYPNFAKLTALLNQQKNPRRTLNTLVSVMTLRKEENGEDTPESPRRG